MSINLSDSEWKLMNRLWEQSPRTIMELTAAVKEERAARAAQVAHRMHQAYLAGCVGKTYPVLFEQEKDGLYTGHAPNYMEVTVQGQALHNQVREGTITACNGETLLGDPL